VIKKRISIQEVARRAGVSISTVSRVINKIPTVHKKNVIKVEEAVAHLKFKPNVSAQRLAKGLNTAVGLVMPGYPGIFHSFYGVELIRGIGHACETLRLDLIFHITDGYNLLNTTNIGGVIFADIIENRKQIEAALEEGICCMVINNIVEDLEVNYVAIDNRLGGHTATDYLVSLGHKKIATVTGNLHTQAGAHRLEGYKKALEDHRLEVRENYIFPGDYSRQSARMAAERFFEFKDAPTAVFAASDDMALELMAVALEKGLKIPEDLSIVGFDDNPQATYGPVALTTIRQPLFQMAESAVKYLNAIVAGKKRAPIQEVLAPKLVVRDSCAAPK